MNDTPEILQLEFEYARTTASEAMRDRHTMMNYYLLVAGVAASGVVALLDRDSGLPLSVGAAVLWGLFVVGWFYFFKTVRLRQAWRDSATAMNKIKETIVRRANRSEQSLLNEALLWRGATLPPAGRRWNVFHFSAMLIGFLNAVAGISGFILVQAPENPLQWIFVCGLGVALFLVHDRIYVFLLKADGDNKVSGSRSVPNKGDQGQLVEILQETEDYNLAGKFRIIKARLRHRLKDGSMSEPIDRINFERGNSAAVLLHDPKQDVVLLARQFRYPIYATLSDDQKEEEAWLLEAVAGLQDGGESLEEVAIRETHEEAGYDVTGRLRRIGDMHSSPGGSSERVTLFIAEVDGRKAQSQGGGLDEEGEDIEMVAIPFSEAMDMIKSGKITDAKTVIALQHLALRKVGKA